MFHDWSYFTESKQYAQRYADRNNPSSLYTTYVKMESPFDTRKSGHRKLFNEIRQEYGLGHIQDSGLPDWTDGYDISDYIDENGLDFDTIILDEGGDLVNGEPVSRGLSYVIRKSSQIKSADPIAYDDEGNVIPLSQRFNPEKADIRYSTRKGETASYTPRSLLANADDSVAQTPVQQKALKEYRELIGKLQLEETQLKEGQQLEAIQDRKGQEAKRQQLDLRRQIIATKDRIAKIKKELGRHEGYVPIKDMVTRERKRVVQEQLSIRNT